MNNNIEQSKLNNIAERTGEVIDLLNEGVEWSEKHLKGENSENTRLALKKYRRKLKKVKKTVTEKPVIALFGASQVGKSYLVKNIFNDETNTFYVTDYSSAEQKDYNFIKDINPEGGGAEATSVVTRFTFDKDNSKYPLPVKIRILSAKAIITIIIDTYLSDIKTGRKNIKAEDVKAHIEEIQGLTGSATQTFLDEDDVFDIDDYIDELFGGSNLNSRISAFKDADYWKSVAQIIHKIQPNNWGKVFEILWGKKAELTRLFNLLIQNLESIRFSEVIYTGMEAVLREYGTILDVTRLHNILNESGDTLSVKNDNNENLSIARNFLCALSHEVILNISEDSKNKHGFIQDVDMLDFPGARSRAEYNEAEELDNKKLAMMLLRGKVSYLFNSYSINYEISNLFVCTPTKMTEVSEIPQLVNMWINYNVGKNKEDRTKTLSNMSKSPLFIIFTWWNVQLSYNKVNDGNAGEYDEEKLSHKWNLRFNRLIGEDIFGKGNFHWHEEWTNNQPTFQNYYLLRDYLFSDDVFSGFEQNKKEDGIKPERQEYYEVLEKSFKNSPLTKNLFGNNVDKAWEESSTVGKDGSQYIIDNMKLVANNITKTNRFVNIINEEKTKLEKELKRHYKSEESDEQIAQAIRDGIELEAYMNTIFGVNAYNFGYFIERLTISEHKILTFYNEVLKNQKVIKNQDISKFILWRKNHPRLTAPQDDKPETVQENYDANLEILRQDMMYPTTEELVKDLREKYGFLEVNKSGEDDLMLLFNPVRLYKDTSFTLAEEAQEFWFNENLNPQNAEELKKLGFAETALENLFDTLKTSYKKLKLTELIAKKIRNYVDGYKRIADAESMIAHITAGIINEFVNNVGWTFYSESEKEKIKELNSKNQNLNLKIPENEKLHEVLEVEDVMKLFDFMENLNDNLNKFPLDEHAVSMVPMIKNYGRWSELMKISFIANCDIPTYDVAANRQLGELIDKISIHNFSI